MIARSSVVLVLLAVLAVPGTALASVKLKVSPKRPIVDDSITVSFRTDRTLKPGYHYSIALIGPSGYGCAGFVHKDSRRRPKKGKPMSFDLSSYDDVLNSSDEWCQGKASIMVSIKKDSGGAGNAIGITEIRFVAKP